MTYIPPPFSKNGRGTICSSGCFSDCCRFVFFSCWTHMLVFDFMRFHYYRRFIVVVFLLCLLFLCLFIDNLIVRLQFIFSVVCFIYSCFMSFLHFLVFMLPLFLSFFLHIICLKFNDLLRDFLSKKYISSLFDK